MVCLMLVFAPVMCILASIEIPGLKLCCRLIQGSAQGCQVNKGGGSTEGKRPSALYGTWQKDTLKDQVRYSAIGKRIQ
jgi:hypothetical protein